jgi:hypothetical protein
MDKQYDKPYLLDDINNENKQKNINYNQNKRVVNYFFFTNFIITINIAVEMSQMIGKTTTSLQQCHQKARH